MPRVTLNQTNFTAGEISPRCFGRVDVARYQNGAESLENCLTTIHGGAFGRYGTAFEGKAKYPDKISRMIPFVFSTTQSYMLEFGHQYVRFFRRGGGQIMSAPAVPLEIASPYTEAMLREIDYTQGADTMLLFHPAVGVHSLKRFGDMVWTVEPTVFTTLPFAETGHRFNTTLTLSAASVGTGRTFTAGSASFLVGDVGRRISKDGGLAVITAFTSATVVTCEIKTPFPATLLAANEWVLEDSPQTTLTPSAKDPVGAAITLSASADSFRAVDVGKHIEINDGMVKVTAYSSPTAISGTISKVMTSVVGSPANAWVLKGDAWNAYDGYPRTGAFYEQRLTTAGSPKYPQTLWGSKNGLFFDYTLGTNDDDAFSFTLPSTGQINPITRMAATSSLLMFTYGGEYTATGGVEKPLTPTNPQLKPRTRYGCNNVKPVQIGDEMFYVTRSGKKIRAMSYAYASDSFPSPNVTTLAEHLFKPGIVDMAYQQEPDSRLWCVRADGKIAALTIDRDEGVVSWSPQSTDGAYESTASIPNGGGDEVWVSVARVINGVTERYIERFDEDLKTDCSLVMEDMAGKMTWDGLDHLEGKEVAIKADGTYVGKQTVAGGEITIDRNAKRVEIGLSFTSTIIPLRPEMQAADGSAQGNNMNTSQVTLLMYETIGGKVDGKPLIQRALGGELLDQAPKAYSGLGRIGIIGWQRGDSPLKITQDEPLPFHCLAIIRKLTVNS